MSDDLVSAVASGDQRAALEALRNVLARVLSDAQTKPYLVPRIASELRRTLADIAKLPASAKPSLVDELIERRKARRAESRKDAVDQ
jgi:hypothetical protein